MRIRTPSAGRVAGRLAALAAAVGSLGLLGFGASAAGQDLRYTRPVEVSAPGWVRVPLAPEILREAAPAGGSLRLFGPEGEDVPFRRVASSADGEWIAAEVVSETRTQTGWLVEIRVSGAASPTDGAGPNPSDPGARTATRHDQVRLELDAAAFPRSSGGFESPGSIQLEASDDGTGWQLLTVARPDRAAVAGDTVTATLAYPASAARLLRLSWAARPGAAGASDATGSGAELAGKPTIRSASVETVPDRSLGVSVPRPECRSAPPPDSEPVGERDDAQGGDRGDQGAGDESARPAAGAQATRSVGPRTICTLPLASVGRHLRRLDLVVSGQARVGFRLLVPEDGRWEPVADGVWDAPLPETPHSLALDLDLPRPAEPLRLELYGDNDTAPGLTRAGAEIAAEALIFRARRSGRHTLAYGAGVYRDARSRDVRPPDNAELRRIEPGPEDEGSAPAATALLPESAGPAPSVQFARRWPVRAESPKAGLLYRLPLAADTYTVARPDLADVRLIASGAQVPYVLWRPAEPVTVTTIRGAVPSPSAPSSPGADAGSPLRVGIDLATPGLPLSALVVHAAPRLAAVAGSDSTTGSDQGTIPVIRRRVRVLAIALPATGGDGVPRPLSPWLDWTCTPRPPLSCRLAIALAEERTGQSGADRPGRLELEIEPVGADRAGSAASPDAESAAGSSLTGGLDLEVWRRQDLLLFPWPADDAALRLTAGAEDLEAPDYELASRRDELLARPSYRAKMVVDGEGSDDGGLVAAWTVGLTLAVALCVLLALLDRILAEPGPSWRS